MRQDFADKEQERPTQFIYEPEGMGDAAASEAAM